MAFDITGLGRASANYNGEDANEIFTYKTTDTLGAIENQDGYFNGARNILREGAVLLAEGIDGARQYQVTSSIPPINVEVAFNTISPNTIRQIGCDSVNGIIWEFPEIPLGALPNTATADINLSVDSIIDLTKPLTITGYVRDTTNEPAEYRSSPLPYVDGPNQISLAIVRPTASSFVVARITTNFDASNYMGFVTFHFFMP